MADLIPNISKGRGAELYWRVENNDPAGSVLVIIPIQAGSVTDAQLRDADTFAAMVTLGVTELNANGWARVIYTDTNTTALTVDDTNDRMPVDIPDVALGSPTTGTSTDIVVCYDQVAGSGTDADLVPLAVLDFAHIPNGAPVTMALPNDMMRAA